MDEPQGEFVLSKGRFEAFSDGVFAIAITLLVLEIHLPASLPASPSAHEQFTALLAIWPQYLVYFASFATIGIMWLNHHAMFRYIERITHGMLVANLLLLLLICFLPFATEVMGRFGLNSVTVVYYALTMVLIAFAYQILYAQIAKAHTDARPRITLWNVVGATVYPATAVLGYFAPVPAVVVTALLAIFYMHPANVRSVVIRPK